MYSLGAKLLVVCARPGQASNLKVLYDAIVFLPPSCRSSSTWSPTGDKPCYLHQDKFVAILLLNLPLGVTNKGREAIKLISGAVAGDSSLQDKGVSHYLLSLIFSLVSLPFSFYFCVLNQKYQKYMLPFSCGQVC